VRRFPAIVVATAVLASAAGGALWLAKRKVRWNDARTMPPPLSAAVRAYAKGDSTSGLDSVRVFLKRYRAPAWESRARVLAAAHLARDGKDRDIVDVLPRELAKDDPLAAHATLLRARGSLARAAYDPAVELAAAAAAIRGFPSADDARLTQAQALSASERWREALAVLDGSHAPASSIEAGRIAASHGDQEGARRRLVEALLLASNDLDADRLRQAVEELLPDPTSRFPAADRPRLAESCARLLEDGRAKTAIDLLRLARPAGAPSAATPAEALIEAEALLKLGRVSEMGALIERARAADPGSQAGARYLDARRAAALGNFGAYRSGLEFVAHRAISPWQERALLDLARAGEGVPSTTTLAAYQHYRAAAGAHADPLALLREAWAAYDLKRYADAGTGFARALARPDAPDGVRITATYWMARMAEAAGHVADARARYTTLADGFGNHYYGTLAEKRLARPLPAARPTAPRLDDPSSLGISGRWLAAARILISVGLWDEASPCYRASVQGAGAMAPTVALEAALAARDAGALSDAIGFAQDAVGDRDRAAAPEIPLVLWRLLYPAGSAEAVTRCARAEGLDPNLVAAVALQESAYNPLAVSSAGARGLLQVMPAVGAELARAVGLARFDASDLFDPAVNLRLGTRHLSDYRHRFGSIPLTLAAYNAGPARVERWSLPPGHDDDERFVERIPIPETRLYVKRVLAAARMYAIAWPRGLGVD
jgi:soluble lytic murein transglycosylase-like protein